MKKLIATVLVALTAIEFVSAAPTVTDINAKQRYPWNGLVDITCKVSGVDSEGNRYQFVMVAIDKDSGQECTASHFSVVQEGEDFSDYIVFEDGTYKLLWDARTDLGQIVCDKMTVRVTLEAIALSSGKVQLWEGGPYWADRNIGADNPWDSGLYFWWGDTKGHYPSGKTFDFSFEESNCRTAGKDIEYLQSKGWVTSDYALTPRHDAAHVKWGGGWRMPTFQEVNDLCYNKCDWTWTSMNGVNGYIVRGRGAYASNSIFLPCSGYGKGTSIKDLNTQRSTGGYYWSSCTLRKNPYDAYNLLLGIVYGNSFGPNYHNTNADTRYKGFSIRPVQ